MSKEAFKPNLQIKYVGNQCTKYSYADFYTPVLIPEKKQTRSIASIWLTKCIIRLEIYSNGMRYYFSRSRNFALKI